MKPSLLSPLFVAVIVIVMILAFVSPSTTAWNWPETEVVSTYSIGHSHHPSVAIGPDNVVHVV